MDWNTPPPSLKETGVFGSENTVRFCGGKVATAPPFATHTRLSKTSTVVPEIPNGINTGVAFAALFPPWITAIAWVYPLPLFVMLIAVTWPP